MDQTRVGLGRGVSTGHGWDWDVRYQPDTGGTGDAGIDQRAVVVSATTESVPR